ncbi:MAG: GNAT family N-acetyltransferase [Bacteroidota bacterium]
MKLFSERLVCYPATAEDFEYYFLLAGNDSVMKHITGDSIDREKAKARYNTVLENREGHPEAGYYWVRDKYDNTFMGLVKLELVEPGVLELGYSLLPEFWGKGFTSEIVKEIMTYVRTLRHVNKMIGIIDPENGPSKTILLKLGFEFFKKGKYQDQAAEYYHLKLEKE